MNKFCIIFAAAAALTFSQFSNAQYAEQDVLTETPFATFDASAEVNSDYLFRGQSYSKGFSVGADFKVAFDETFYVTAGTDTVGDVNLESGADLRSEVAFGYVRNNVLNSDLTIDTSVVYIDNPQTRPDNTVEVRIEAEVPVNAYWGVRGNFAQVVDSDNEDTYVAASLDYAYSPDTRASVTVSGIRYDEVSEFNYNNTQLSVEHDFSIGSESFTGYAAYSFGGEDIFERSLGDHGFIGVRYNIL